MTRGLSDTIVYREGMISKVSFWITLVVVLGLIVILVIWGNFRTVEGRIIFWSCASSASLALFLGLCLTQLVVTVTQTRLILVFGVIKRSFPRESIISTEPTFIRLSDSGGYGIRRGRNRTRYWVAAGGSGLKVEVTDSKSDRVQTYVFSSTHPERLANILDIAWKR